MAVRFTCPRCGAEIETELSVGEVAWCEACDAESRIPGDAERPSGSPDEVGMDVSLAGLSPFREPRAGTEKRGEHPRSRARPYIVFCVVVAGVLGFGFSAWTAYRNSQPRPRFLLRLEGKVDNLVDSLESYRHGGGSTMSVVQAAAAVDDHFRFVPEWFFDQDPQVFDEWADELEDEVDRHRSRIREEWHRVVEARPYGLREIRGVVVVEDLQGAYAVGHVLAYDLDEWVARIRSRLDVGAASSGSR